MSDTASTTTAPKPAESRVKKTLLNARVNLIFYFLTLLLSFFSRKIFLDCLGADFVGLTGTLGNLLGYLNLAELGVGAAISFNLYKPLQEGNREKIKDLISLFGYYYRNIGLVVLGAGVILSCFIPLIFRDSDFPFGVIYFAFFSFLTSSLIGYFINYRQILLTADQRNYVVLIYYQTGNLIKVLVQMAVALKFNSYYAWIGIELCYGVIYCIILNWKINKVYPWLKCSVGRGKKESRNYPYILKSTKQIFVHKIKDFLLNQSDQLFIFAFVSLKMVAYYGNYVLIIGKLTSVFGTVTDSVGASVGNLVAEGNKTRMMQVFWELMAIRYFIAGLICFSVYQLISPFIVLWLGEEYLLSQVILVLLLVNLFIGITRGTVDNFNHAYGHYADIWAAWVEGAINITVTLVCGYFWGIAGILLGKTASLIPIVVLWKPLYLFRDGFRDSYLRYWLLTARYYVIFGIAALVVYGLLQFVKIDPSASFIKWIIYSLITAGTFAIIYFMGITLWGPGGRNLVRRLPLRKLGIKL